MTDDEYEKFFAGFKAAGKRSMPKSKRSVCRKAKGSNEVKDTRESKSKASFRIVVTAKRVRGIDPDNVCAKWYIDEIVRAGHLPDDSSKYVTSFEKRVEKVKAKEQEETIIEIWKED